MQPFDYVAPRSQLEASKMLAAGNGRCRALQGGTDLLIRVRGGAVLPETLVDLKGLPGMQSIREEAEGWLAIGAACTMNHVARDPLVCQRYDLLVQACNSVASYQLRNRATLGGNVCNASPAADTAPALFCLGAVAEVFGPSGRRRVPIDDFIIGPGRTVLAPGEFLTAVLLPPARSGAYGNFHKLGRTKSGDLSIVSVAVYTFQETASHRGEAPGSRNWRIGLGAVGPTPLRAVQAEESLALDHSPEGIAAAAELAAKAARPIDDVRASASYRTAMVRVLTRRGIEAVLRMLEIAS